MNSNLIIRSLRTVNKKTIQPNSSIQLLANTNKLLETPYFTKGIQNKLYKL